MQALFSGCMGPDRDDNPVADVKILRPAGPFNTIPQAVF